MKRETDRLRVFTKLALAAALFTLFRTFPLSGDDWFREGLGASLHSIGDLACVVAEKWRTTNGRILGNILAYSAGSRPILRDLLRALITLVLIALLARAFQADFHSRTAAVRRGGVHAAAELFREAYPWAAGYFNYVPPVACLLAALALTDAVFAGKALRESAPRCLALFALGFASQLFVENVTLCTLCAAGLMTLWYLLRERRLSPSLLCWLLGALGGAALLFASPSYAVILHGGGMYHAGVSGGLAGLLASAQKNSATVFRFLLADCPVLYVSVAALLTLFFARARTQAGSGHLAARGAAVLHGGFAAAHAAPPFGRRARGALPRVVPARDPRHAVLDDGGAPRTGVLFPAFVAQRGAAAAVRVPRRAALPVRELSAHACRGLQPARRKRPQAGLCPPALRGTLRGGARLLHPLLPPAAPRGALREAMLRGERTVRVPACGDTAGLLWEPNTPKMEYAYFYITPGDLSIEFETR